MGCLSNPEFYSEHTLRVWSENTEGTCTFENAQSGDCTVTNMVKRIIIQCLLIEALKACS